MGVMGQGFGVSGGEGAVEAGQMDEKEGSIVRSRCITHGFPVSLLKHTALHDSLLPGADCAITLSDPEARGRGIPTEVLSLM